MMTPQLSDLALVVPELILVGMALVLLLLARRIRGSSFAPTGTVGAALVAALFAGSELTMEARTAFGGMIVADGYSQFFKVLVGVTLALTALLSVRREDEGTTPRGEYHALLLLAGTGMMVAVSTQDLLVLYLSLELMTLCSYILVGLRVGNAASNEAAIKYFLLASFASALLIYGIALTYGATGTTEFGAVAAAFSERGQGSHLLLLVAIGLVVAGLAFKIAAVPFHSWAPDAYQGASSPVAAFLASGSKAVGLAALGRVALAAFGPESQVVSVILMVLAGASILAGSIIALSQRDMKRMLAYSSISHAGYALLGLMVGTQEGASATMTYAFFYVFMTLGTFGVIIALGERGETLDGFQGLAAQRPGTAALMLLFLMSLTGIPPTAGFAAKFYVILSAVRSGYTVLAVLAVACTVISAFFYMRVAVNMYMKEPQEAAPARFPLAISAALAVAALVTLLGGVSPGILAAWAVAP
jgi:NADH-quinone oxidoreductase subunit N